MRNHIDVNARFYFNDDVSPDDVLDFIKKIEKSVDSNLIKQKDKKIGLTFTDNMIPLMVELRKILKKQ